MKNSPYLIALALLGLLPCQTVAQNNANEVTGLAERLERFPQADTNRDGSLTRDEWNAFNAQRRAQQDAQQRNKPKPTHADVAYGDHERHVFDIWLTPSDKPTPLVIYIHGGGFRGGNKNINVNSLKTFQEAGLSVAAIHYRLSDSGPYPIMMEDAARCLHTIRHRAKEWNIDRQSTRITAAATTNGQSTYDLRTFREWFGVPNLRNHEALYKFYDVKAESDWNSTRVKKLMKDASAITHLTKDDVPVYMTYNRGNVPVDVNTSEGTWVHHVRLGLKLQEAMSKIGLECTVVSPDHPETRYASLEAFLIAKLKE